MQTSELIADAKDTVDTMRDLAQTWTNEGATLSWQVLMGQPTVGQDLEDGGYKETVRHEIRIVASGSSWTTGYGSACAAALSSGAPVAALAIGKVLVATEQGNRKYRIMNQGYKPGSGWVVLEVSNEANF
jgi:hypothetical protein